MKIISKLLRIWKEKKFWKVKKPLEKKKIIYKPPFEYDYTFKIILLGEPDVGKVNLTQKLCYKLFHQQERLTIGVDFHIKTMKVKGKKIKMQIWDVAGEEQFNFLMPSYCLGANAVMIIYDVTNSKTLKKMDDWVKIIRTKAGNIPIVLIGNKVDLEEFREISTEYGLKIAKNYNLSGFSEISTKTGANVEKIFKNLSELIMNC
ncbi:MAG: Rab family GTPase [Promethearchaeota archaeon]